MPKNAPVKICTSLRASVKVEGQTSSRRLLLGGDDMRPKMKNYPVTDRQFADFLIECMKFKVAITKFTKSLTAPCAICEAATLIDDTYTCDRCGKSVCADHIVGKKLAEDDVENVCTNCLERF